MNQENIFKLLLIILLLSNNYNEDCPDRSVWASANDVILMALLLGVLTDNSASATNTETTF